ncbi:hypothetical protein H0G86_002883 [Trichoderma simmonsii]|uniref:Uncharacterized protein n=1 Tax=Trichoderma simmonsii TaxID=1491479 RepID=A0A8G0L4E4_9HYPO|nr:hypothetical protein H0G86_002883 [Trichoderma simmonsii]
MKYRSDTELLPGVTGYPAANRLELERTRMCGCGILICAGLPFLLGVFPVLSDYGFAHLAQRERACATLERCFCKVPSCSINGRASMRNTPALAPRLRFRVISRAARPSRLGDWQESKE